MAPDGGKRQKKQLVYWGKKKIFENRKNFGFLIEKSISLSGELSSQMKKSAKSSKIKSDFNTV